MGAWTRFFNLFKPAKTDGVKVSEYNANMDIIDAEMHKPPLTVNGNLPNEDTRDIYLETVPLADNLSSDDAQFNSGVYLIRASGGGSSIADGAAALSTIRGNAVKTGYVPEVLNMSVSAVPRVAPPAITAVLDDETFIAYVVEAGTYTLSYTTEWDEDPADYGVTVSNTPVSGDSIVIVWDGENAPEMTVNAVERPVPAAITATIDKDVFRAYVPASGTVTLSYTSAWSANPALYGITVYNTPVTGDVITVEYVKENRGTITVANVTAFNATGWNLFQTSESYAHVVRYSDDYGYKIGGSYSLVNFATTPTGTSTAVDVDANGYFNIPSDGYVIVTGADSTTYIYPTWSDWTEGYEGEFQTYTVDTVDLSEIMVNFDAGLCAVGDVRDEINFNTQKAISRIERLQYTTANLETVIASGRPYDTDTNYIYVVRGTYVETQITIDGTYTVSDHGEEFYTASTTTPPVTETIYGNNLKDKLRTDVLTISAQTLSASQQAQVLTNIGGASQAGLNSANAAITDLNSNKANIANLSYGSYTFTSQAAMETGLVNLAATLGTSKTTAIYMYPNFGSSMFGGAPGVATIETGGSVSYFSVLFHNYVGVFYGKYLNGTWSWEQLALKSEIGTQVEILDATETSVTEKTLSQSIDNFRYIIIEALSNNGAIFSSQIVPVAIFKTHTSNTNPIMLYFYDGSGYKNMFVRYSNTTTVYTYVSSGFHLILRGIK